MYKVAIIDDEPEILDRITSLLKNYKSVSFEDVTFEIDVYLSGEEFLSKSPNLYEIIILDINMPGINGLTVAKKIRKTNKTAVLFFCTNYAQYAINGYEVGAAAYIVKPIKEESFYKNLKRTLQGMKMNQDRRIQIKTVNGTMVAVAHDLIYIEVKLHNLFYNAFDNEKNIVQYRSRGTMQEMENSLSELNFVRCSACYLVNLQHVLAVVDGCVKMKGGAILPISKKFSKSFMERFAKFLSKKV